MDDNEIMMNANAERGGGERRYLEDIRAFSEAFPEAARDPRSIPAEVWDEVRGGGSLVGAYARYLAGQSSRELEALRRSQAAERQNAENAMRSTGTMRSVEGDLSARDAFLRGFLE